MFRLLHKKKAEKTDARPHTEAVIKAVDTEKTTVPALLEMKASGCPQWLSALRGDIKEKAGIDISFAEIKPRATSQHVVMTDEGATMRVPFLILYTLGNCFNDAIREPEGLGLAKDSVADAVRDIWRVICGDFKLDRSELYDRQMYIGIQKTESVCFDYFARTQKNSVREYVARETGREPQSIFASSIPALTIVFSREDYEAAGIDEKAAALSNGICALAAAFVREKTGLELENTLHVAFMHPKMSEYNGYGLSRED